MSISINFICRILFNNWMIISLNVHLIIWMRAFFRSLSHLDIQLFASWRMSRLAGWLCSRGVVLHNENIAARVNNKKNGMYILSAAIRQLLRSSRLNTFLIVCCCSFYWKHQLLAHTRWFTQKYNSSRAVFSGAMNKIKAALSFNIFSLIRFYSPIIVHFDKSINMRHGCFFSLSLSLFSVCVCVFANQ